ncbi:MAG: CCA tRNA nucleotidyltransferase [Aerococcus sp.]|nr:CCA tRNA nucleotidyltransferase [Aerococcus sp.]
MVKTLKTQLMEQPAFREAKPILDRLTAAGFEAYFVGGSIRDALLGQVINDVDIATSAYPSEVQAIFPKHFDVGLEHGTVMALVDGETYEITTFRTESTYQDYRRPDHVTFVRQLADDLLRRDFTINALAMDATGTVYDYFTGLEDLKAKTIRAVGTATERFHEDALRMMRAVRFASQLDFAIDPDTTAALQSNAPLLEKIAVERIRVEMEKLWIGTNWQRGLNIMMTTDLYRYCPLLNQQQQSLMDMLHLLSGAVRFPHAELAWAVLLWMSEQHTSSALSPATLAGEWKLSNKQKQMIDTWLEALNLRVVGPWEALGVYAVGIEATEQIENWIKQQQAAGDILAQQYTPADLEALEAVWAQLAIHSPKDLAIHGGDIIQTFHPEEKPQIGEMLRSAEEAVVIGMVSNDKEAILSYLANQYQYNYLLNNKRTTNKP